ncbi:MAG: hypothetical protein COB71_02780 [Thiotrichales bacterium]|nr:MAG: hypothetical protein COB71_02780 [Thiotrichales bacterium]
MAVDTEAAELIKKPGWNRRFGIVLCTLLFCAGCVGYILWADKDTETTRLIVIVLTMLAGAVIGSYVFGAAWDDKNFLSAISKQ